MKHNPTTSSLTNLDALLAQLLTLLHQEGKLETHYAQRTLERMRRNLALAAYQPTPELLALLREDYASLFPPRSGLSEFYRWHKDVQERIRLNRAYQDLIGQIEGWLS